MNPVVHFEMPYEDADRAASFYSKTFGWTTEKMGAEMGNYLVMTTTEMDPKTRFPKEPGRINGGMYKKNAENFLPSVVISVDDIREAMKKVEASGGKIVGGQKKGEPDEIPGVGLYISFIDTEGNKLSLLQPSPRM